MTYTAEELDKLRERNTGTDWDYLDALTDEEIERGIDEDPDAPPRLEELDLSTMRVWYPDRKERVTMRLDKSVLDHFRKEGKGYQSRINAVLRGYIESRKSPPPTA